MHSIEETPSNEPAVALKLFVLLPIQCDLYKTW